MNVDFIVALLLEDDSPYDVDDPLEKQTPEEAAAAEKKQIQKDILRYITADERRKKLSAAAKTYYLRQNRKEHPDGYFDRQGRWYPSADEEQPCCAHVRRPSGRWPYSLLTHGRSLPHIANLYGVELSELRRFMRGSTPDFSH